MVTHTLVESFSESKLSDPVGERGWNESTQREEIEVVCVWGEGGRWREKEI